MIMWCISVSQWRVSWRRRGGARGSRAAAAAAAALWFVCLFVFVSLVARGM